MISAFITEPFPMSLKAVLALLTGFGIVENVSPSLTDPQLRGCIGQDPQQLLSETDIA